MSKIGRKPIQFGSVSVEVIDGSVHFKGKKASGIHELPAAIKVQLADNQLKLTATDSKRETKMLWGLHRALLANKIKGAAEGFKQEVNITGLGFKAALAGKNIIFSLGFSHKIEFPIPEGITITIDKTGQILTVEGNDRQLVGSVCSEIRALRPPEPYKGTGIKLAGELIIRKAGKTKAA